LLLVVIVVVNSVCALFVVWLLEFKWFAFVSKGGGGSGSCELCMTGKELFNGLLLSNVDPILGSGIALPVGIRFMVWENLEKEIF
jgi:hypothetical protein